MCYLTSTLVIFRLNPSSGVPLYQQLMDRVKHAVETGALREGDQLPTIRKLAEDLAMNPNTVIRAYRELEHEGLVELRHGSGAYIRESSGQRARVIREAQELVERTVDRVLGLGLSEEELRRVFENELAQAAALVRLAGAKRGKP